MLVLFRLSRLLVGVLLIGVICYFFYALGKKRALENKDKTSGGRSRPRKFVQCKVVENEEAPKNGAGQQQ